MMRKKIIKWIIGIDDYLMKTLNMLVIKEEGGVHPKHRLTKYHDFFVKNVSPTDRVLDIGCGNGFVANSVAKKARLVLGIDLSRKSILKARERFESGSAGKGRGAQESVRGKKLKFVCGDATSYNFSKKWDVIILSNVLEHIRERDRFLRKIKQLAPKILIRVPMINRDWLVLYKKELGLPYFSDKGHFTEYTRKSFRKEMRQAGLKIENYSVQFGEIWAKVKEK